MSVYVRNRNCGCHRCRARGLTGAAVLITLGILFLLDNFQITDFDHVWPVVLIVIGLTILASRSASTEGHIQPNGQPLPMQSGSPAVQDNSQVKS